MIRVTKGLDLPIMGRPETIIEDGRPVRTVAVLGGEYVGMRPTMAVAEGDRVSLGQVLFTDKKNPGVAFTAPAGGRVSAIHRGEKRALVAVVIDVDGDDEVTFEPVAAAQLGAMDRAAARQRLVDSGLWTALRTRPFNRIPPPDSVPSAIFVTAMDTQPLGLDVALAIKGNEPAFMAGQSVLARLTDGPVYVCAAAGSTTPRAEDPRIRAEAFEGPHPAGLPGTHIHFLHPVGASRTVWFVGAQDVIAIGELFVSGRIRTERLVALGGPGVLRPRVLRTRLGASLDELTAGELAPGEHRVISGSVLSGHTARGGVAYLGRYHQQVSVLPEDRSRSLIGYLSPGINKHSNMPIYLSRLRGALLPFTTSTNGSPRAMVPIGSYERVVPLDVLPTHLLRALLVGDIETAIALGALELDEDDVALCTYCCPGKYEYGPVLRKLLTTIEKEG